MRTFFRVGLVANIALVIAASVAAYTGIFPVAVFSVHHFDLLGHALFIGGLAFFVDGALDHRGFTRDRAFPPLGPTVVIALAGVEELAQRFSARRSSSWSDFAADVIGVCVFTWMARRLHARYREAPGAPAQASR